MNIFKAVSLKIASTMAYFSAALGPIPEVGVDLRVNQIAAPVAALNIS